MVYDEAASSEEERTSSIRKILSKIVNLNADADMIVSDGDEDSAIQLSHQFNVHSTYNNVQKKGD
jgi:hypothetical protein